MRPRIFILALVIVGFCCVVSFAQLNDDTVQPGNLEPVPLSRPIAEYALAGGSLIAALAVGFFPSKRSTRKEGAAR